MHDDLLLTTREAAAFLGVREAALRQRRHLGMEPAFIKEGRHVRYRRDELVRFRDATTTRGRQRYRERDLSVLDRAVDGYLREKDACAYLGLSDEGLLNRRRYGTAPAFVRRGRSIWYSVDVLDAFDVRAADTAAHRARRTDDPSYWTVHQRLKREHGPAKDHPCILCDDGTPGAHWSYLGDPIYDRVELAGREKGLPYSTDPIAYAPACRKHAKALDEHPGRRKRVVA